MLETGSLGKVARNEGRWLNRLVAVTTKLGNRLLERWALGRDDGRLNYGVNDQQSALLTTVSMLNKTAEQIPYPYFLVQNVTDVAENLSTFFSAPVVQHYS
jgi:hypothetical protein